MFDEMRGSEGAVRPAYAELSHWLGEIPPDVLDFRRREAEHFFRRIGITFAVYGDAEAQERLIPFDVIPRILAASEWQTLQRGLEQRVKAINAYIKDVYNRREVLKAGIVPEDLVFQNPVFRPEMNGQKVPHDIYVHIAGIDIVRVDADDFYVLEDNARTPSGVSYMLENREIMLRLFPELFSRYRVAPVENYPDELLATLKSIAPPTASVRSDRRAADARRLQLRLLRTFLPRRQARRRTGRRPRSRRQKRRGLYAHHRRLEARRCRLPPHRRRLPRSAGVPARQRARRARPDVGLSGRQRNACQRGRHRRRRRQSRLQLHAGHREVLSRRRAASEKRPHLALPRSRAPELRARPHRGIGDQRGAWLRRLRHADRAEGRQGRDRRLPHQAQIRPEEFHRPADAGAVDLPDLRRGRHRAAPRRSSPLRTHRP